MGSVKILVGPKGRSKKVGCVQVAQGLVAHTPPDLDKNSGLLNLTHAESGLCVLQHLPEEVLPSVISLLNSLNWEFRIEQIYESDRHFQAIVRVVAVANREDSKRQEAKIAKDLGGRVQPGSGSVWGYRRDVITKDYLIEAKCTDKARYLVSDKDFAFLCEQAYGMGKVPAYFVGIQNEPDVVVLPYTELPDVAELQNAKFRSKTVRNRKSVPVTLALAKDVNDGVVVLFETSSKKYALLGYDKFLDIALRGINE